MMHAGRPFIGRLMKWKDTTLEDSIKTALLSNLTITPTSYITIIGLISWSQNVPTWNQVEKKIWDEAPYAVGAHCVGEAALLGIGLFLPVQLSTFYISSFCLDICLCTFMSNLINKEVQ